MADEHADAVEPAFAGGATGVESVTGEGEVSVVLPSFVYISSIPFLLLLFFLIFFCHRRVHGPANGILCLRIIGCDLYLLEADYGGIVPSAETGS